MCADPTVAGTGLSVINKYKIYFGDSTGVAVHMRGFDEVQRGKYFGGELIKRSEVEMRMGKLRNGKTAGKDEGVTEDVIKDGGDMVVD